MNDDLRYLIKERVAYGSVGGSTVRNMGPEKTMSTAQEFLADTPFLEDICKNPSRKNFNEILDAYTELLRAQLPIGKRKHGSTFGGYWGCARKCLNIFLFESTLNKYLCEQHKHLQKLEPMLEVPLDGRVGACLDEEPENEGLLKWDSVIRLEKGRSDQYQTLANAVADRRRISRVQLDLLYFRVDDRKRSAT